jgi:hypothetical protein
MERLVAASVFWVREAGTVPGLPPKPGIPSAPGNVPKYWSNERFSCMMITTCRIF